MTHREIIEALGGYMKVALEISNPPLHYSTVFKWMKNGIPEFRYKQILALCKRYGLTNVTLDVLYYGEDRK